MSVDVITDAPDIAEATYSTGDLMAEGGAVDNATVVTGGKCILQSITAIDTSDTGGAIRLIITPSSIDLGTVGSAVSTAAAAADEALAIVDLTNWVDIGSAKVCTKGNIGVVCSSAAGSKALRYGIVNVSGGDIVIGSGEDIIFNFGLVKD